MKYLVPEYYREFKCIAEKCNHTCCRGWEIEIDNESLSRFSIYPDIMTNVHMSKDAHIILDDNQKCPFLNEDGLCNMILTHGEDILCDICRDHPRFRNYWTGITEIGLGLVCEEACRIILSKETPMKLDVLEDDGSDELLPKDEKWLFEYRQNLLDSIDFDGPEARLLEYLIYRHIPDALYDGRLEERVHFIRRAYREITSNWNNTSGSIDELIECARKFSYDVEYDDEVFEDYLNNSLQET